MIGRTSQMRRRYIRIWLIKTLTCPFVRDDIDTYLMGDQPTCCPLCGTRTGWVGDSLQLHTCRCGYDFLVEDDPEYGFSETGESLGP